MDDKSFLGRGWNFPPEFKEGRGVVTQMVEDEEDIRQSLHILFSTRIGERFNRDYGSGLYDFVFEPVTSSSITRMKDTIKRAILLYEPRIEPEKIHIDTSRELDGVLMIELNYRIRQTNTEANWVYPFYLQRK